MNMKARYVIREATEEERRAAIESFSEQDWLDAEKCGQELRAQDASSQLVEGDEAGAQKKTCAYLCSKSKQFCNPDDLSPCHGTGGTCTYYCW